MTKDWVQGVSHSPVYQILLQIVVRAVITSSPPAWTSSARMLSTPADFPFFNDCSCSLNFSAKGGVVILCACLGTVQYWWISVGIIVVQLRAVFCPSVQYLSFFCEAFSWTTLDSSSFSLFHSGKVFQKLVCPLTVVLPQIFSNLTTQYSYPVFFCLFHAPLEVVVHFVVFLLDLSFQLYMVTNHIIPFIQNYANIYGMNKCVTLKNVLWLDEQYKHRSTHLDVKTWELLWEGGWPQPGSEGQSEVGHGIVVTTVYSTYHFPLAASHLW